MNFKNKIRFFKPIICEFQFRFLNNVDGNKIRNKVNDAQNQWKSIINTSNDYLKEIKEIKTASNILFVSGYGLGAHFLRIEPIIMMALHTRGCHIISLYCNKSLPSCEFNPVGNNIPASINELKDGLTESSICAKCNSCKKNIESIYGELPIEMHGYDNFLNQSDYQLAYTISQNVEFKNFREFIFSDIKIGEEAYASILRVTFKGEIEDSKLSRYLVKRYIMSGILTTIAYEKSFIDLKPDRVVCIHGIYQTHGLAVKVANKLKIPVIVIGGGGIRKDTVVICHNETYHRQLVNESNSVWEKFVLSDDDRKTTLEYASKKRNSGNGADYLSYHPNPIEDVDYLYKYCKIDKTKKIISLYTNVIWDAQIFYDGNAFKDIFEWLFLTITELGKNENIWLVIRIHPAESKGGLPTNQPMLAEINKYFKKLPENVRIIPPESDISSYVLAQESYVNIIYGTKMGLEIALMKKPLIVCGETFSRNKGFGIDIENKETYILMLEKIQDYNFEIDANHRFERAMKYANFLYFRKMLDMPINSSLKTSKLQFSNLQELSRFKSKSLDVICEGIIELSDFYLGA